MDKLYESKVAQGLQKFGAKLAGNRYLLAISSGLMVNMSLMLVGAIFQIIASPPITEEVMNAGGFWATVLGPWYRFAASNKDILMTPYNMTMGMISVIAAFAIAYQLAKSFKMNPLINGVVSMIIFLMVASPAKTVVLSDGTKTFTGLDTTCLGGVGIFTAILVAIVTVKIYKFCEDKKIVVKMPSSIPAVLSDSFSSIIPLLICIILFHGANIAINAIAGTNIPIFIAGILAAPFSAMTSFGGMIIICIFAMLLWTLGIQGTMVVYIAIMPIYFQAVLANGALVAAGQPPVFQSVLLFGMFGCAGGTGNLLGFILLGLRSKSQQIKAVSKVSLVPAIFGITEPAVFGYPFMYNPILAIPFIINPVISVVLGYFGYISGFLIPPYVLINTPMPIGIGSFLMTMSWTNLVFPFFLVIVSILVFLPFYKIYERQLIQKEKAVEETAEAV